MEVLKKPSFDYSKLLGRIREMGMSQKTLAPLIPMTETTLSYKLNNESYFRNYEINQIANLLHISDEDYYAYFFTQKVQKTEQNQKED